MKLENIRFPLYVVHSDEVLRRDGVLWVDGAVLDDTNVHGESLGERRLRTPLKNMYLDYFGRNSHLPKERVSSLHHLYF